MVHKLDEERTCSRSRWCKQNTEVILFYLMGVTKSCFFKIGNPYGIMHCSLPWYIKNEHP